VSKPGADMPLSAQPRRAWWKLLLEALFVLYIVAYNVSLVLNDIASDPKLHALTWVRPCGILFTVAVAGLWALFLIWVARAIWRRLRREYQT
jgi:hypothetical protein